MKKMYFILTAILMPVWVLAQYGFPAQERLHFFVAPVIEIGEVAGKTGLNAGMMGGLRVDKTWLGVYELRQYRFCMQNALDENCSGKTHYMGIWSGWEQTVTEALAIYGGAKAAWGLIELQAPNTRFMDADYYDHVFVMTPEAGLIWQVGTNVQVAWMAGYRWVDGIDHLPGLTEKDFRSMVNTLSVRLGW